MTYAIAYLYDTMMFGFGRNMEFKFEGDVVSSVLGYCINSFNVPLNNVKKQIWYTKDEIGLYNKAEMRRIKHILMMFPKDIEADLRYRLFSTILYVHSDLAEDVETERPFGVNNVVLKSDLLQVLRTNALAAVREDIRVSAVDWLQKNNHLLLKEEDDDKKN